MLRSIAAIGCSVIALTLAGTGLAQVPDDEGEVRSLELEQARTQMNTARRDLEEAARTIAVQARVFPDFENLDFNYQRVLGFGGPGRIGATIVDADNGALVTALAPGGSAEEAGIRVGDVIVSVDDINVTGGDENSSAMVIEHLRDVEPGETVAVVVERRGESLNFEVETAENPPWVTTLARPGRGEFQVFTPPDVPGSQVYLFNENRPGAPGINIIRTLGFASSPWADMELVELSEELGRYFDTSEGLLVVRSPENDAIDIQDGDVILSISGRTPNSPEHAIRILSSFEAGETIELSIMRDGRRLSVEYAIPEQAVPDQPLPRNVPLPD